MEATEIINNEEVIENAAEEVIKQSSSSGAGALVGVVVITAIGSIVLFEKVLKPGAKWVYGKVKKNTGNVINAEFKEVKSGEVSAASDEA